MDTGPSPHPTTETLQAYGLGKLDDALAKVVSEHLEDCPNCRRQVTEMAPDTYLGGLPGAPEEHRPSAAAKAVPGVPPTRETAADSAPVSSSSPAMSSTGQADAPSAALNGCVETSLPSGKRVGYFGDYELLKVLGEGGMGTVYKARQLSLNRLVALKMIKATRFPSSDEVRRFQNESEAVARLDHPNIVPVFEVGQFEDQHYFSMKLIAGESLDKRPRDYLSDPRRAAEVVATAARAIHHAHRRGILHRDLKPANILIDSEGLPHVTDFGLAKRVEGDSELTRSGAIMGTPAYMAPEQASGKRGAVTTATDVYGLGAILYVLLTGKPPFGGDNLIETLDAVRTRPPEPPTKLNANAPRDLETICLKCLEKDSQRRYYSAQALADDLRAWLERRPIAARPPAMLERVVLFVRRKPVLASAYGLLAAVVFLTVFGGTIASLWRAAEKSRAEAILASDGEKKERIAAESARERLAAVEYGRTMEVALHEWQNGSVAATVTLLDGTRPDFRGWEWRFLHRLSHADLLTLKGHSAPVYSAAFSPDGSRVVTASGDKTAKVWDANSGAQLLTLKGHTEGLASAAFSPDGSRVVTTSGDKTAKVWDSNTGAVLCTLNGHSAHVASASFSPDGSRIVTGGGDYSVRVWNSLTGEPQLTLRGNITDDTFTSVMFGAAGSQIMASHLPGALKVWNAENGVEIRTLDLRHKTAIFADSRTKDDRLGRVKLSPIWMAQFSPDESRIVTRGMDDARVWDAKSGAELVTLKGHKNLLQSASFSPDGSTVVTASFDKTAKIWDAKTGAEILTLKGHYNSVHSAAFSPDGSRVVTSSSDMTAKIWDANTSAEVYRLNTGLWAKTASWSPDGTRIVANIAARRGASILDAKIGTEIHKLKGHTDDVRSVSFSPDGSRVVSASRDKTAKVWDAKSGAELLTLKGHSASVNSATFSADGSRLVTASSDKTAKVWDVKTGIEALALKGHTDVVYSASFSPDATQIVTSSSDKTAKVWDVKTGAEVLVFNRSNGDANRPPGAWFSPDGTRIITANGDMTASVWNSRTGAEVFTLKGHTDSVVWASFSPDGSRLVTASYDNSAKVWDAKSGVEVLTLQGSDHPVVSASFSPDGTRILTLAELDTAMVWEATPLNREFLKQRLNLTPGPMK